MNVFQNLQFKKKNKLQFTVKPLILCRLIRISNFMQLKFVKPCDLITSELIYNGQMYIYLKNK